MPKSIGSEVPGVIAENTPATITVERPKTDGFGSSTILVDGKPAGKLRRGRPSILTSVAGDHLITVFPDNLLADHPVDDVVPPEITEDSPATIRLCLSPGERVELICESNQPWLPSLVRYVFWAVMFYVAIGLAGDYIPAWRAVIEYLAIPMLVALSAALVLGFMGLTIWVRRAYKSRGLTTTVVSLNVKARNHQWFDAEERA